MAHGNNDKPHWRANDPEPPTLAEMHTANVAEPAIAERLGDGTISWIASLVSEGTSTPDDARRLLAEFVRQIDAGERISHRLLEHMRDCIVAYLDGRRVLLPAEGRDVPIAVPIPTLEKACGLTRAAPGNPPTDADTLTEVAMEVLQRRIVHNETLEQAAAEVAEDRKARQVRVTSESQIREAWPKFAQQGLLWLRIANARPWTSEEETRLNRLFWGKLWFAPPGVDAAARQKAILAAIDQRRTPDELKRLAELDRAGLLAEREAELTRQQAIRVERARAVAREIDAPFHPKFGGNTSA